MTVPQTTQYCCHSESWRNTRNATWSTGWLYAGKHNNLWWYSLWKQCFEGTKLEPLLEWTEVHERLPGPWSAERRCSQSSAESLVNKGSVQVLSSSLLFCTDVSLAHCSIRLKVFVGKYLEIIIRIGQGYKTTNFHRCFNSFSFFLVIYTLWCSFRGRIVLNLRKLIWRRWFFLLLSDSYTLCRKGRVRQIIFFWAIILIFQLE